MKKASYWIRSGGDAQCCLCPHSCNLSEGQTGLCKVRRCENGELVALGYGELSSSAVDPIEKKPLSHFHPGSSIFSIGGWGCNFSCSFCQNWTISQQTLPQLGSWEKNSREDSGKVTKRRQKRTTSTYSPEDICRLSGDAGSIGVAYTYNEPLINYEFVLDCSRLVRQAGRLNVLVTNGYIQKEPASELLPFIDALNIDIKSMDNAFYKEHCGGAVQPVLDFARQAASQCHVEITNLLIPGLNDRPGEVTALAEWIADNLGKATPLHLSAYFPQYKSKNKATPYDVVENAAKEARVILDHVEMGNVR
jgi:pyruvate formate lyase activating enzyme